LKTDHILSRHLCRKQNSESYSTKKESLFLLYSDQAHTQISHGKDTNQAKVERSRKESSLDLKNGGKA